MKNALTIDIEDWYQTQDFNFPPEKWSKFEDRIQAGTDKLLKLLDKYQVKATFFILGYIARKHPELIQTIVKEGHELGSHGNYHRMVTQQTKEEFRKDLLESKLILEEAGMCEVKLYRAASWSLSQKNLWMLHILEEEGFICDSSLQPFWTPLSGFKHGPTYPFHPVIDGTKMNIVEFPSTVLDLGLLRFPFSGGLYLRVCPASILRWCLQMVNKKNPGMIYLHPWEIDTEQPRLKVPAYIKFAHYYNLSSTISKAEKLLGEFAFVPMGTLIKDNDFPSVKI